MSLTFVGLLLCLVCACMVHKAGFERNPNLLTLGSGALIRARRTLLSFCDVLVVLVRNPDGSRRRKSLLEVRSAGDGVRPSDWGTLTLLNNQDIFVLSALGHTHVLIVPSLHV